MTRQTTYVLAVTIFAVLALSAMSGAVLAFGHNSTTGTLSTGSIVAAGTTSDRGAVAVTPSVAPTASPATLTPATSAPLRAAELAPRALGPLTWGITINPDGSVSGTGAGQVTSSDLTYYNFSADYSGSILDERNGSIVFGGAYTFTNSTGNPIDLEVANASNVQLLDFYFVSGFISLEISGSTNISAQHLNDTLEPDDSATYNGAELGVLVTGSTAVFVGEDQLNGTDAGVDVVQSGTVELESDVLSGGYSGTGEGLLAAEVETLYVIGCVVPFGGVGLYVQASGDVYDDYNSIGIDAVGYGVEVVETLDYESDDSNYSYAIDDGIYADDDAYVSVDYDNLSAAFLGSGLYVADTTYIDIYGSDFYFDFTESTSAGIIFSDDSCSIYSCYVADDTIQYDWLGIVILGTPDVLVRDSSVDFDEWGVEASNSSEGSIEDSNLSNAGWFGSTGFSVLLDNDTYFEVESDVLNDNHGAAAAYLYGDADVTFEGDEIGNSTNAGILAGQNAFLDIENCDLSNEVSTGPNTVGISITASSDVYVDSNNLTGDYLGVVDQGVGDYGEFDDNEIGGNEVGIEVVDGSDYYVDDNVFEAGAVTDFAGVEILDSIYATVEFNLVNDGTFVGVYVIGGSSNEVYENNATGDAFGIYYQDSIAGYIEDNFVNDSSMEGITIYESSGTTAEGNYATTGAAAGVYVYDSVGASVTDNDFADSLGAGVSLDLGSSVTLSENNLTGDAIGVSAIDSFGSLISQNQFDDTPLSVQLVDDSSTWIYLNDFIDVGVWSMIGDTSTYWNASYPIGGNYWSNLTTSDSYSGPFQNLAGSDGINDTPFVQGHGTVVDEYPLVSAKSTQPTTLDFTETGVPSYTDWYVQLNLTYPGSPVQSYSESGYSCDESSDTVSLSVSNGASGTYTYTVRPMAGFVVTPSTGTGTIPRGTSNTAITFTPFPYTVTFTATGITSGTAWNVTVGGHTYSSTTLWDNVSLGNGTHAWTAAASGAPTVSGSVTVHTGATSVTVGFQPPTYTVVFTQTGLPSGDTWTVTFNGIPSTSSLSVTKFAVPNGTYAYTVTNTGTATPSSPSGSVTVTGAGDGVAEAFIGPTPAPPHGSYYVVFTETGLASGASWSVSLDGGSQTSAGDVITFEVVNGSYPYTVTTTGSVAPNPASGTLVVSGTAVAAAIAFGTSGGTTSSSGGSSVSTTELYALLALAVVLGILAVIGWTRSGRGGASSAPGAPAPPAWSGPTAPPGQGGTAPTGPGAPPPTWQEPPSGGPPTPPPS